MLRTPVTTRPAKWALRAVRARYSSADGPDTCSPSARSAASCSVCSRISSNRSTVYFHLEADPAVHGEPVIAEPAKYAELRRAPLDALPRPLLWYTEIGVELYRSGRVYAALDWPVGSDGPR